MNKSQKKKYSPEYLELLDKVDKIVIDYGEGRILFKEMRFMILSEILEAGKKEE